MDTLNHDTIYHIMQFLPISDAYHLGLTSPKNYDVFRNDDRIWKSRVKARFGDVTKDDIYDKDSSWYKVYRCFAKTYIHTIEYLTKTYTQNFILGIYSTFLYRDESKAMVLPDNFYNMGIKPRHGDMLIDLGKIGYRNEGVSFYNQLYFFPLKDRSIPCFFEIDDYGSVPLDFSWPTFPLTYYIDLIDHNKIVNLKIKPEDVTYNDGIFTITSNNQTIKIKLENGPLSLEGFKVLAFENDRYYYHRVVVMELVTYDNGIYSAGIMT